MNLYTNKHKKYPFIIASFIFSVLYLTGIYNVIKNQISLRKFSRLYPQQFQCYL